VLCYGRVSVHPSVTSQYSVKTTKHNAQTTPHDSHSSFMAHKILWKF